MYFDIRLQGGKIFHIGYLPPGPKGGLEVKHAPEFCHRPDFQDGAIPTAKGVWMLRRLDEFFDCHEARQLCRPVAATDRTPGVGLIEFPGTQTNVSIFLSPIKRTHNSLSILEDWSRIIAENKDDAYKDLVLRMEFGDVTAQDIDCLRAGKYLATLDIGLRVDASDAPWQWARDD